MKRPQPVFDGGEITEVRAEGRRMKPMSAVLIVIGTMMVMSIVLSFSEIYQTTSEIARLEADLAALRDQAAELELELEEKNDIRVIERIATEDLGMVKEDAVQRKYISLSDGERIDIIEDETAETDAAHGVLLSSIWSSLGSLFDYFR
jgi:cell division protein FtsL